MSPSDPNSPHFAARDDSGLPDWLTGTDALSDSDPPLLAGLLDLDLPFAAEGAPRTQQTPLPTAPRGGEPPVTPRAGPSAPPTVTAPVDRAEQIDEWQLTRQDVRHDPADTPATRSYRFSVSNTSPTVMYECMVEFALPPGCSGVRANRSPQQTKTGLEWKLGLLAPGERVWLSVQLPLTAQAAPLKHTPAVVQIATRRAVPLLTISAESPAQVSAGRQVPVTVVLTNSGRAPVKAGKVAITGAAAAAVEVAFSDIPAASESRISLTLPSQPAGVTQCLIVASAPQIPPARAVVEFATVLARVGAALTVPPQIDLNEEFACRLEVVNPSPFPVEGTRIALPVPEELVFRGATAGGALSTTGEQVEWVIDRIPQQGAWETTARFAGFAPGRVRLIATVSGPDVQGVSAEAPLECVVRPSAGGTTLAEVLARIALPAPALDGPELAPVARATGDRYLVVRTAHTRLALPPAHVRDVLRPLPLTTLPGTPDWVAGVANVRGDIVTVIDLAGFLDLGEAAPRRGLVIIQGTDGCVLGLLVDDITGIRSVSVDADSPIDNRLSRFLAKIGTDATGIVHRLAVTELLAALETELGEPVGSG
jgi:chemotaxis signal transduction protein